MIEPGSPTDEPAAVSANEESHATIADFVGQAADAPTSTTPTTDKESDA